MTQEKRELSCNQRKHANLMDREEQQKAGELEALGFDYVKPHTFTNQVEGYWRLQFSWGGPSDELRGYVNEHKQIHRLEYWFMDWYDGSEVILDRTCNPDLWQRMQYEINIHGESPLTNE